MEPALKHTITLEDIQKDPQIHTYIEQGNRILGVIGYTEHGFAHAKRSSNYASYILKSLGYDDRTCELAAIAGYMHDIGNVVNRVAHAQSGALMAFTLLTNMGMDPAEIAQVVSAIGNHDEGTAAAVNPIAAALILSDKGDVLDIDPENKTAILDITIDTDICPVMDYFEIFLTRMVLCRSAAQYLGLSFELVINAVRLL